MGQICKVILLKRIHILIFVTETILRTDEGQTRPKYIFNNIYFFLLYRGLVHHHHLILNQEYIFKPKPKQNCTTHLLRNCWNYLLKKKCQLYTKIKAWKLVFDDTWFHLRTYLFETIIEFQLVSRFWNISWLWDNYSNLYQCQFSSIYVLMVKNKIFKI